MVYNCKITTYDAGSAPSEAQKRRRSAGQLRALLRVPVRVVPLHYLLRATGNRHLVVVSLLLDNRNRSLASFAKPVNYCCQYTILTNPAALE
jgi:hypothetical protein